MSVEVSGIAVVGDTGQRVGFSSDGHLIEVRWTCGDSRSFQPEDLLEAVANVRLTAEEHPGVWVKLTDYYGQEFAVAIVDGELYADNRPGGDVGGTHVPWRDVRKAARRMTKEAVPV